MKANSNGWSGSSNWQPAQEKKRKDVPIIAKYCPDPEDKQEGRRWYHNYDEPVDHVRKLCTIPNRGGYEMLGS